LKASNDDVYSETFYHFIWTTKARDGYIEESIEGELHQYIRTKCEQLRAIVLAVGGMPDHVHLACTFPNTLSISEFVSRIKGSSSHFVNHHPKSARPFAWRPGYGVLTFAKAELPRVVRYIERQKIHHGDRSIHAKLERTS
jgi:putative transposase